MPHVATSVCTKRCSVQPHSAMLSTNLSTLTHQHTLRTHNHHLLLALCRTTRLCRCITNLTISGTTTDTCSSFSNPTARTHMSPQGAAFPVLHWRCDTTMRCGSGQHLTQCESHATHEQQQTAWTIQCCHLLSLRAAPHHAATAVTKMSLPASSGALFCGLVHPPNTHTHSARWAGACSSPSLTYLPVTLHTQASKQAAPHAISGPRAHNQTANVLLARRLAYATAPLSPPTPTQCCSSCGFLGAALCLGF